MGAGTFSSSVHPAARRRGGGTRGRPPEPLVTVRSHRCQAAAGCPCRTEVPADWTTWRELPGRRRERAAPVDREEVARVVPLEHGAIVASGRGSGPSIAHPRRPFWPSCGSVVLVHSCMSRRRIRLAHCGWPRASISPLRQAEADDAPCPHRPSPRGSVFRCARFVPIRRHRRTGVPDDRPRAGSLAPRPRRRCRRKSPRDRAEASAATGAVPARRALRRATRCWLAGATPASCGRRPLPVSGRPRASGLRVASTDPRRRYAQHGGVCRRRRPARRTRSGLADARSA